MASHLLLDAAKPLRLSGPEHTAPATAIDEPRAGRDLFEREYPSLRARQALNGAAAHCRDLTVGIFNKHPRVVGAALGSAATALAGGILNLSASQCAVSMGLLLVGVCKRAGHATKPKECTAPTEPGISDAQAMEKFDRLATGMEQAMQQIKLAINQQNDNQEKLQNLLERSHLVVKTRGLAPSAEIMPQAPSPNDPSAATTTQAPSPDAHDPELRNWAVIDATTGA